METTRGRISELPGAQPSPMEEFFTESDPSGSVLRTWLRYFDPDQNMKITFTEFCDGCKALQFQGDVTELFRSIDTDNSGELSLDEVDSRIANLWTTFRLWCVQAFDSVRDMLLQVSGGAQTLDRTTFIDGLRRCGWTLQFEEILFEAMDTKDVGMLSAADFKWFAQDQRRQQRKEKAKARALWEQNKRGRDRQKQTHALHSFKALLRQRHTSMLRAWRRCIDFDESMTVHKTELYTACGKLGWLGDCRALWEALDADGSGMTTLEELDLDSALHLAKFKQFLDGKFGSAVQSFRAFDRFNSKKLKLSEFAGALKGHGYTDRSNLLFHALDRDGKKFIVEENMLFLDRWRVPPHLICKPNDRAAIAFGQALLRLYPNFVKAWRHCLDRDGSNKVSWQEFVEAAEKMKFVGDIAGAWRHMDSDFSGFITLREVDPASSDIFLGFKSWADDEFGSARAAFGLFDSDASNDLSLKEFRRACKLYGFSGDCEQLFRAFDVDGAGRLSSNEVSFLDDWDVCVADVPELPAVQLPNSTGTSQINSKGNLIGQYQTAAPGPDAYDIGSTIGTKSNVGVSRSGGACSIASRKPWNLGRLNTDRDIKPAGADYDVTPGILRVMQRQPSCNFSAQTELRKSNEKKSMPSLVPGPGHYTPFHQDTHQSGAPRWSFAGRNLVVAHPLEKAVFRKLIPREPPRRLIPKAGLP
eukprot:gnl/MRDRNA2_/MRDRNA2_100645_c0_seq1.p1 gnl/MRDRNA2_/MRDRNA2_100645_c0~~gnl/MRDRNA2_/MRDRNA2_100645_c0_seq1.p1  ORF type:complete len:699 (+),score=124.53 gnl/MRDRNA2_/MRDRNA2_100645_c0_seq1:102-2198(+)